MTPTIIPTVKQHEAWESLRTKDIVFFGGGAGGGKSWWLCETRLVNCYFYPGYKSFIGREELKRLMQSTFITWSKVCKHHKIPQDDWSLNSKYNYIEFFNGSRIDLLDLAYKPSDPLYERLGSLEYSDGAIEESGEVHSLAYDVLKTRIGRHLNQELGIRATMVLTGNPKKNWTYSTFFKPWQNRTLPQNIAFIQSLYSDNPYTAAEYKKQLMSISDKSIKERLMFGNWDYEDDPASLVDYDAICDMFTNDHVQRGEKRISADLAMQGRDRFIGGHWEGLVAYLDIDETQSSGRSIEMRLTELKNFHNVPNSRIVADSDGIGAYLESYIRNIKTFHGNATAENKEYTNIKSECAFKLAEVINGRKIKVVCNKDQEEKIKNEISVCLKRDRIDADESKKRVISKEKMKESLGHSPDYFDWLLMGMYFEVIPSRSRPTVTFARYS